MEMNLGQRLYELDKQAADLVAKMEVEEKNGPMKAHLYEQMVDEHSQAGSLAGAAGGAILGVKGSDLLDQREGKRLAARQNKVEADALLKQQLAVGALTDPSRLDQYGHLADEAQAAERAFLDNAEAVRLRSQMSGALPTFTRRLGAGLVGATALGIGAGETMKRLEHNRLNQEEGLGIDEQPLVSAIAGTAGAVGGGLVGRHFRPVRLLGRTNNGLVGALAGASAGVHGTDLGFALADRD